MKPNSNKSQKNRYGCSTWFHEDPSNGENEPNQANQASIQRTNHVTTDRSVASISQNRRPQGSRDAPSMARREAPRQRRDLLVNNRGHWKEPRQFLRRAQEVRPGQCFDALA